MVHQPVDAFLVGNWCVEPALGRISGEAGESYLRPKEMDLLVYLAEHDGRVVSADDIMSAVWADVEVTNDSLYTSISQLRKHLDEPGAEVSIIETMPRRGYRLTVPVRRIPGDDRTEPDSVTLSGGGLEHRGLLRRVKNRALYGVAAAAIVVAAVAWLQLVPPPSAPAGVTSPANSIAVMPLIDLSPDTDYTYFSDGITDEILNRLARVQGLSVAARTSSFAFKDSEASIREIGDALGVGTILEGSVRKDRDLVRVSVQLIDTDTGFQLWSETYERELGTIFAIQNEISRNIADALELTLAADLPGSEAGELSAYDPRIVDEYLLGLEALRASSFDSYRRAIGHFENVLRVDPTFTPALIQLADAKLGLINTGASYDMELVDQAEQHVRQALEHDPRNGAAYRVLGMVSRWRGEWQQAREHVIKALELAPSDSVAMVALGAILTIHNELDAADQAFERALRIDPYGAIAMMKYAWLQQRIGEIDKARATIERAIELHPANPNLPWMLGKIQVGELGDLAGGLGNFLRSTELDPQDYEIAAYVAMTYLTLGMPEAAEPWIDRAMQDGPDTATSQAIEATYLQLAGDKTRATLIATSAIRERNYRLLFHELLSDNLIVIAVRNLLDEGRVDDAIDLLEEAMPAQTAALGPGRDVEFDGTIMVMNKFSDAWMVALAGSYLARGDADKAAELIERAAENRLAEDAQRRGVYRNDHYLMQARVLAMQGEDDAALDLLDEAVSRNLIFGWQIQVAGDYAFRHLQSDMRFRSIVNRLEAEVDRQRAIVLAQPSLVAAGEPGSDNR